MLPPQHAEKLLYDGDHCTCDLEWHCVPHNACFIHDSCFYKGSGSFPLVKTPCLSWSDFSYDWYCELASHLELHPHSPLPCLRSEVEYSLLVMPYYRVPPPSVWSLSLSVLTQPIVGQRLLFVPTIVSPPSIVCLIATIVLWLLLVSLLLSCIL